MRTITIKLMGQEIASAEADSAEDATTEISGQMDDLDEGDYTLEIRDS